ncbi:MAG: DVU0150 family protein [Pseudomonadota bacterium]
MRKIWIKLTGMITMVFLFSVETVLAGGEKASLLVIVADTRKLSGWEAWFANLYNESHLYFTILTVVSIPIIGVIFGVLADLVMSRIGIDLKSRELSEH